MKYYGVLSSDDTSLRWQQRLTNADITFTRGVQRQPQSPRGLVVQSAPRGVLVSWSLPIVYTDIVGWRIYKDTETNLFADIRDRGTRQYMVDSTGGSTPPNINIFISSVSALGIESPTVQIQGSALAETGAPTMPSSNNSLTGTNKSPSYSRPLTSRQLANDL